MAPKVPPAPTSEDYNGAASRSTTGMTATSGSGDIWGLDKLYNQPIYLGTAANPTPHIYGGSGDINILGPNATQKQITNSYGTTQDFLQHVVDLWNAQEQERKKFPNQLTTYEKLQQGLWQAGFYGQTPLDSVHVGEWTQQTQSALVSALQQYETASEGGQLPLTFTEFLQKNAVMGQDGGPNAGGGASAPQVNLADPAAIRAAAQSAAQQALGMNLSSDQLEQFVSQFQAAQTSAQQSTGSTVTAPELSADAMAFAQQQNPKAYKQNQRTAYLDALVNLFGGVRPSVQPTSPVGA